VGSLESLGFGGLLPGLSERWHGPIIRRIDSMMAPPLRSESAGSAARGQCTTHDFRMIRFWRDKLRQTRGLVGSHPDPNFLRPACALP
jgi:hypothetical protein